MNSDDLKNIADDVNTQQNKRREEKYAKRTEELTTSAKTKINTAISKNTILNTARRGKYQKSVMTVDNGYDCDILKQVAKDLNDNKFLGFNYGTAGTVVCDRVMCFESIDYNSKRPCNLFMYWK